MKKLYSAHIMTQTGQRKIIILADNAGDAENELEAVIELHNIRIDKDPHPQQPDRKKIAPGSWKDLMLLASTESNLDSPRNAPIIFIA